MPCLKPIYRKNPRYQDRDIGDLPTPLPLDLYIYVPCGKCVECRKSAARDWRCRLLFEIKESINKGESCYFVTFTVNPENYEIACSRPEVPIRRFLESYRKRCGKSLRHFFITELGETTGRFHYHGIVFGSLLDVSYLRKLWRYGYSYFGWCSFRTGTYITKYILKPNPRNPEFRPRKFVSPGLGKSYVDSDFAQTFYSETDPASASFVCKVDGFTYTLPRYFREKLYSEHFLRSLSYRRELQRQYDGITTKDLTFKGVPYVNPERFCQARSDWYEDSIRRGMSSPPPLRVDCIGSLSENKDFSECMNSMDEPQDNNSNPF